MGVKKPFEFSRIMQRGITLSNTIFYSLVCKAKFGAGQV
jgi:hypothetical protein